MEFLQVCCFRLVGFISFGMAAIVSGEKEDGCGQRMPMMPREIDLS
jgi:hypothetical protein